MASLSLEGIQKIYPNGFHAVKDFNLEIADKEFHHLCRTFRMWKIYNTSYGRRSGGYLRRYT